MQKEIAKTKKPVAIVTMLYKAELSADEQISIRHLTEHLGHYDKFVCVPKDSGYSLPGFKVKEFPARYFRSAITNAKLLSSVKFHRAFQEYEYILLYEIDCLVFSDQLMDWVNRDYDYVAAPWIKSLMIKRYEFEDAVGGGGFALRKVDTFLKVIKRNRNPLWMLRAEWLTYREQGGIRNYLKWFRRYWFMNMPMTRMIEDRFFALQSWKYVREFKKPSVDEALHFSIEVGPRLCYERIGKQLPFGCHAWARYDREFWKQFTLTN